MLHLSQNYKSCIYLYSDFMQKDTLFRKLFQLYLYLFRKKMKLLRIYRNEISIDRI